MITMMNDLKDLVKSEVEAACKEKEDRLWKNGKEAFANLHRETREKENALMQKMASLEENLVTVSNEQKSLQSLLMDINNRVENMFVKKKGSKKADSESTKTIKSTASSERDDGEKNGYTSPLVPLWGSSHAHMYSIGNPADISNPQTAPSYEILQQQHQAQAYQVPQPRTSLLQAPPGLSLDEPSTPEEPKEKAQRAFISLEDALVAPEPAHIASKTKSWQESLEEWGLSTKDTRSTTWNTSENSSLTVNSVWNSENDPWAQNAATSMHTDSDWGSLAAHNGRSSGQSANGAAYGAVGQAVGGGEAAGMGGGEGALLSSTPVDGWRSGALEHDQAFGTVQQQQVAGSQRNSVGTVGIAQSEVKLLAERAAGIDNSEQWQPMTITMMKSADASTLGTDVNAQSDGTLSVETILPGGLVWKYNESQTQIDGDKVSIGDRICVVNGKTDPTSMLAECKSRMKLDLIVLHRKTTPSTGGVLRADANPFEPRA